MAGEVVVQLTGRTDEDVDDAGFVGIDGRIQRIGFGLECRLRLFAPFDDGFFFARIDEVDASIDGLLGRLDGLKGDRLLQMGKLGRLHETCVVAEHDGCAQLQQFGTSKCLGDQFKADAVYISVGDTYVK